MVSQTKSIPFTVIYSSIHTNSVYSTTAGVFIYYQNALISFIMSCLRITLSWEAFTIFPFIYHLYWSFTLLFCSVQYFFSCDKPLFPQNKPYFWFHMSFIIDLVCKALSTELLLQKQSRPIDRVDLMNYYSTESSFTKFLMTCGNDMLWLVMHEAANEAPTAPLPIRIFKICQFH